MPGGVGLSCANPEVNESRVDAQRLWQAIHRAGEHRLHGPALARHPANGTLGGAAVGEVDVSGVDSDLAVGARPGRENGIGAIFHSVHGTGGRTEDAPGCANAPVERTQLVQGQLADGPDVDNTVLSPPPTGVE